MSKTMDKERLEELRKVAERADKIDWNNDADLVFVRDFHAAMEPQTILALLDHIKRMQEVLENISIYGCGMLNQPAAMNGPEEAWLRKRIWEYERIAREALEPATPPMNKDQVMQKFDDLVEKFKP